MPSWKKVILSGSDAALNSLDVTTNVTATSFTGSLLGTASYAAQAASASYVATASYTPTLQQVTSQGNLTTSSIAVGGITSSVNGPLGFPALFKTTNGQNTVTIESSGSSGTNPGEAVLRFRDHTSALPIDGTITYGGNGGDIFVIENHSGAKLQFQGPINDQQLWLNTGGGTGSILWADAGDVFIKKIGTSDTRFFGTASYADRALSSSFAITASFAQNVNPLATASYASQALSSSYALSASYSVNATSASHALNANNAISASYALSSSYSLTATSASHALNANNAISASYALSSSYALTATSASHALNANNAISASYSLSGSYSLTATSASHALNANNAISSSYALSGSYSLRATSASYALTASYAENIVISGSINNVNYIDFNTGSGDPGWKSGRVYFNNTDGALTVYNAEADIALQVGQENWTRVRNVTGATITNGTVVRIEGAQGDVPTIVKAASIPVSGAVNLVSQILGVATHNIEDNSIGYITTQGFVRGLNTNAYSEGDTLFVSSSAGLVTITPPPAPYEIIPVGIVTKVGPGGSGIIYVAVQQPLDFSDLSTVEKSGSYSYGDLWTYVPSGSFGVWTHTKQLSGSYNVTGSWSATSFTGSLLGTASYAAQALSSSYSISSSYAVSATTASFLPSTTNLNVASISASNAVFQSASIGYLQSISGSAKIIGDAFIILNNDTPTERYAGIIVQDSGSILTTASFQYDGQTNDWFYEYSDDGGVTADHAVAIFGPEYNTKGSPTYLTANRIPKSDGTHHLNNSNISDNGTVVSINSNTQVTGSLNVSSNITSQTLNVTSGTGSFTGSFTGLFDGISASQIATGTGTVNTLAKWNTTSSLADSSITDNGSNVRIAVNTTVTGSITNTNSGFKSVIFTSGSSIANTTTNGTLFNIDSTIYESITLDYVVFNSTRTNKRAGTLRSTWDDNTSTIVFDETTTTDIGDTTAFTLDVTNSGGGTVTLRATNNVGSAMTIIYEYKLLG
jgi:hypothetical protein